MSERASTPGLPVCAQTLAAAVAPPTGGAGVVRREAADAAEVAGRQRGGRGRCRQVVGLRPLWKVLPMGAQCGESADALRPGKTDAGETHLLLQQCSEVLPEALLEVIAPRLPLLFLCAQRGRRQVNT